MVLSEDVVVLSEVLLIILTFITLSLSISVSLNVSLSVGPGVFSASPETDDSDHLYGRSFNRSHHLRRPVGQVITYNQKTCEGLNQQCCF